MIGLVLAVAHAGCGDDLSPPGDTQSVVWISPLRKSAGANSGLRVVPMRALREAAATGPLTTGRLLQLIGERKKAAAPRREWKVTVFEASSGALCRPIAASESTEFVAELPVCLDRWSRETQKDSGCGTTVDRASGREGVPVYRARWRDLAPQGFCVLPADRFVQELSGS